MNILIIDDDLQIIELLQRTLKTKGHILDIANSGMEGWELFSQNPDKFDLIITDVEMPEMDGIEFLNQIRQGDQHIPVIIMTGNDELDQSIKALRLGAYDYLIKPFSRKVLFETLAKLEAGRADVEHQKEILPYFTGQIKVAFPSNSKFITRVVSGVENYFKWLWQVHGIDVQKTSLCIQEALANGIIHGSFGIPSSIKEESWEDHEDLVKKKDSDAEIGEKTVILYCEFTKEEFICEVEDPGDGFDSSSLPEFDDPMGILLSGRGLLIIRTFMDEVSWNEKGNRIKMVKKFDSPDNNK